jgi:hypothetical protein
VILGCVDYGNQRIVGLQMLFKTKFRSLCTSGMNRNSCNRPVEINVTVNPQKCLKIQPSHNRPNLMDCRPNCGACCIAPSISTLAKPAGVPCRHLDADFRCLIFISPERPKCCSGLQASPEMCGETRDQALIWLSNLEAATRPG